MPCVFCVVWSVVVSSSISSRMEMVVAIYSVAYAALSFVVAEGGM
jgi:hypothetical protein